MFIPECSALTNITLWFICGCEMFFCFCKSSASVLILTMIADVMGFSSCLDDIYINRSNRFISNTGELRTVIITSMKTSRTIAFHIFANFQKKIKHYSIDMVRREGKDRGKNR